MAVPSGGRLGKDKREALLWTALGVAAGAGCDDCICGLLSRGSRWRRKGPAEGCTSESHPGIRREVTPKAEPVQPTFTRSLRRLDPGTTWMRGTRRARRSSSSRSSRSELRRRAHASSDVTSIHSQDGSGMRGVASRWRAVRQTRDKRWMRKKKRRERGWLTRRKRGAPDSRVGQRPRNERKRRT
jgi:hypothetical protein